MLFRSLRSRRAHASRHALSQSQSRHRRRRRARASAARGRTPAAVPASPGGPPLPTATRPAPAPASRTILSAAARAEPSRAASGAMPALGFNGLPGETSHQTSSSPSAPCANSVIRRCPPCAGLKLPPSSPVRIALTLRGGGAQRVISTRRCSAKSAEGQSRKRSSDLHHRQSLTLRL